VAKHQPGDSAVLSPVRATEDSLPHVNSVFEQPWWLEAVAPGSWGETVVRRNDSVAGRLAYAVRRLPGVHALVQPPLTPTLGPWLAPSEGKYAKRLETEKKLLGELIEALPRFDMLRLSLSPTLTNWLPFYWAGFQATVRYTYRIDDLSDLDRVRAEFQEQVRRGIRKAESAVEVDDDFPLDRLLELNALTFERQGLPVPYSDDLVRRIDAACASRGARRILGAIGPDGRPHAALYIIWDERTLYPIINARDPELQAFGANTLLYWEAIRLAADVSQAFDFEGSMLEPVEHFVRAFGGRQTPYFAISKIGLRARPAVLGRELVKAIRSRRLRTR
jgi:hypothetical protein